MTNDERKMQMLEGFKFDDLSYDPQGNIVVTHSIGRHTATWTIEKDRTVAGMLNDMHGFLADLDKLFTGGR